MPEHKQKNRIHLAAQRPYFAGFLALLLSSSQALAERPLEGLNETARFQELWASVVLAGDADDFPRAKLRGRYHGQFYHVDGGDDGTANGWENRRIRLGLDLRFSEKFEFAFDANIDRGGDSQVVNNIDFAAFDYLVSDDTAISFGKLRRSPLTREDSISSNRILTIERSLVASRFFIDNLGGVFIVHQRGDWAFGGGVISGSLDDDLALPTLDGKLAWKANLAYQATPATELRVDYLYNEGDADNNGVRPFRHVVSANSYSRWEKFGVITDLIYAKALADAPGDIRAMVVLPHYQLTPRLQVVARYTRVTSNAADGVRLPSRYDRRVRELVDARGNDYQAWYAGLNYYIYGHKLKLMSGLEYSRLARSAADYSGVTASASLRLYF